MVYGEFGLKHDYIVPGVLNTMRNWVKLKKENKLSHVPVVGSLAVYRNMMNGSYTQFGHIGIVVSVQKKTFTIIEGNSNEKGSREGFTVAVNEKKYNWNTTNGNRLLGFIIPDDLN